MISVLFRHKDETEFVGCGKNKTEAMLLAVKHLRSLNVDREIGYTWPQMVLEWEEFTDGYEAFLFETK